MRGGWVFLALCLATSGHAFGQVSAVTLACDLAGQGVYKVGGVVPLRNFGLIVEFTTPASVAENGRMQVKSLTDGPDAYRNGAPEQMGVVFKVLNACQAPGCETIVGDEVIVWGNADRTNGGIAGNLDRYTGVITMSFSDLSKQYIETFSGKCKPHSGARLF